MRANALLVGSLLLVAVAGLLTGLAVTALLSGGLLFLGVPILEDHFAAIVVSVIGQGLGFALTAGAYLRYRGYDLRFIRVQVPTMRDVLWTVVGLLLLFSAVVVVSSFVSILDIQEPATHEIAEIGIENPRLLLVLIPLSFLIIGPGEELLFRGIIQTRLARSWGKTPAIVGASVVFTLAHLGAYQGEGFIASLTILFALSLILGWVYERTNNLVVPALVHGAYNAALFVYLYMSL